MRSRIRNQSDKRLAGVLNVTLLICCLLIFGNVAAAEDDRPTNNINNLWYSHINSDTVMVFVHGVLSDSRDAWTSEDKGAYWPALVRDDPNFDGVSIFLGGFYTAPDSADYGMRDAANQLFTELIVSTEPADVAVLDIPKILFVTHSTGGIVVRDMLERHADHFEDKTVGLVLIASPSIGSRDGDRLDFISKLLDHRLGKELQWNNPFLEELDKDFKNLVNERRIPGLVGEEWLEHHLLYSKWLGIARGAVLVEKESAGRYFGEPITLHGTDHISAVKPADRSHPAYRRLRFFYEQSFIPAADTVLTDQAADSVSIIDNQGVAAGSIDMGGGDINVGSPGSSTDAASSPTFIETGGVEFTTPTCAPNGPDLKCSLRAVSRLGDAEFLIKGPSRYGYYTDVASVLIDAANHEYPIGEVRIADKIYVPKYKDGYASVSANRRKIAKRLVRDAPADIVIVFKDAASAELPLTRLEIGGAIDEEPFMIEFSDVSMTED